MVQCDTGARGCIALRVRAISRGLVAGRQANIHRTPESPLSAIDRSLLVKKQDAFLLVVPTNSKKHLAV